METRSESKDQFSQREMSPSSLFEEEVNVRRSDPLCDIERSILIILELRNTKQAEQNKK